MSEIRDQVLQRLKLSRETFRCSAAAYALLTSESSGKELERYKAVFHETGFSVQLTDESAPAGISLSWSFHKPAARAMMDTIYAKMISESVEATRDYASSVSDAELKGLNSQPWFLIAIHLRNAFSHNNRWEFKIKDVFPVKWRSFEITRQMEGHPAAEFLPWFQGTQLCAQMINYVSGVVDYRQNQIPKDALVD